MQHAYFSRWDRIDASRVSGALDSLSRAARQLLEEDGVDPAKAVLAMSVDLRYVGQEHFLTLPASRLDARLLKQFHSVYKKTFGHSNPAELVEVVNLRLTAVGAGAHAKPDGHQPASGDGKPYEGYPVRFRGRPAKTPRYRRQDLRVGEAIGSPCIIDEESCTTVVPDGWMVMPNQKGWLEIRRTG